MTTRFSRCSLCLLAGALAMLAGCATTGGGPGRYVVTSPKAPFYKYGPAQAFGADFALNRGQQLTVVENSFGFAKVTTDDGITGYMPSDDLAPAPPAPAPQIRAEPRVASRRAGGSGSATKRQPTVLDTGLTLMEVNDLPLPTNAEPAPATAATPPPKTKKR